MCPDAYTQQTRLWLDATFVSSGAGQGLYNPVYGFGAIRQQAGHAEKIVRAVRLLQLIARERPCDLLDVGAAEGYLASCVRQFLNIPAAACDLSLAACQAGRTLLGVPTFSCSADCLPVADQAFDCVLCSEVIEHLADPLAALAELMRVTRRVLVITSLETLHSRLERYLQLKLRNLAKPHAELNLWLPCDFRALLGHSVEFHRQYRAPIQITDHEPDSDRIVQALEAALTEPGLDRAGIGGIVIWRRHSLPSSLPASSLATADLIRALLAPRPRRSVTSAEDEWLRARLCAPQSLQPLTPLDSSTWVSLSNERFPVTGSVPVLLADVPLPRPGAFNLRVARRLAAQFRPQNVWMEPKLRLFARTALGVVELLRDLRRRVPLRVAWRQFAHSTRFLRRRFSWRHHGWLVHEEGQPSVYRIDRNGRRLIPSPEVLAELGYDFSEIVTVSAGWLAKFPEGPHIRSIRL